MFRWLYRLLFAPRIKWVLECKSDDGTINRLVIRVWDPSQDHLDKGEELMRKLAEDGWTVKYRPRRLP